MSASQRFYIIHVYIHWDGCLSVRVGGRGSNSYFERQCFVLTAQKLDIELSRSVLNLDVTSCACVLVR